jgi:hypothetical protein
MMRRTLAFAAAMGIGWSATGQAGETAKDLSKELDEVYYVETSQPGIKLNGYVDAGYTYNFVGNSDALPLRGFTSDAVPGGDFSLNQIGLVISKELSEENEFQAGFHASLKFGEDAADLGANGAAGSSDSFYLQEAYVITRIPVGNGLDILAGKYAAFIGYEAEERYANINITPGMNSIIDPAWHVGAAAFYKFSELVDVGFGVNNGNAADLGTGLDGEDNQLGLTGFVNVNSPGGNANVQLGFYSAPMGDTGYGGTENEPLNVVNVLGNWTPQFAHDKLLLAFNSSAAVFGDYNQAGPGGADLGSTLYTLALYSKYSLTDIISVAGRAEYLHTCDDQFLALGGAEDTDAWGWTGTLGFDLSDNVLLRFEYRVDWGNGVRLDSGGGEAGVAQTFASQIVYAF